MTSKGSRAGGADAPIIIKKYANRRLYNTATSSYVTLDHLAHMVKDNSDFVVYDAKTGEDITRSVLTQIIVEEESKGQNLLPIGFLRQLIGFYGDSLGGMVPQYLEYSMQSFARNEEQMRGVMKNTLDGLFPFSKFDELNKQNLAFYENAMSLFNPFKGEDARTKSTAESDPPASEQDVDALKKKISAMQQKLDKMMEDKEK
ncbi:polyhydroxyalkanoate synthesis repressor PhaR [Rhodospirillum rubrum]|uniref:Polyhydroxyalkanoate synthesis repressor PhaR n=1 Tax=Rhodospirillum rubrum (strain ATCC 11170 / ATH 1.1.1 / DSM 467 / LMG 4362 / NCIMB 8255 / S1) TaxID=269796 RepID=Q2RXR4_RHORT|nr:polyhydroxyalkanoate synthesis repressor PhaR [Rhodospirillum rubrum]ABC21081.1 Polyhydroxyalkanoate synthesis repressor PhaR [Rhodospirillum rubrum ATCC 11170]AEO46749.1 polyhydroxyalkanoate synthesis repressor PhaR [Rhodospirillum rubrum F11]MBK1665657.1 polyhydroxyalkanoate synthesis repressor PhaR [Rhodospirillum rubrum]MBK1677750.1 polyhydroxyalkanoate synthesis repressor PhaR [Rhodospirillum rubrum]MBK5952625.1 polyhydroxyalkanoate synthesis repressor PhaR [Rhodospirillum rubrum]